MVDVFIVRANAWSFFGPLRALLDCWCGALCQLLSGANRHKPYMFLFT